MALVGTQSDSVPKKAVLDDSKKMRSNSTLVVKATSTVVDRLHGEAELVFGHLVEGEMVPKLMSKAELMEWFDALRVFEVGTEPDGSPIIYDRLPHVT
jgi:hypothetical protein